MASGMNSNSATAKRWRSRQRIDGKSRIVIWTDEEITQEISHIAFRLMVPKSVAVEHILRSYFGKGGLLG